MLKYEVHVEGALEAGHPLTKLENNLTHAIKQFDAWVEQYPYHDVTLEIVKKLELKRQAAKERPTPKCPHGHDELDFNKLPVVRKGGNGTYFCTVCGWRQI